MSNLNFLDTAVRNNGDALTGLIEGVTIFAPEASVVPTQTRAGTSYKTVARVGLPGAGFRLANQSISSSKSIYESTVHQMFFLDVPLLVDEAVYKADDGITSDLLQSEQQGALQSAINKIGSQFYYGTSNDGSNGFVGVRAQLLSQQQNNPTPTAITASNNTTSSTAYGLWLDPKGVCLQLGKHGQIEVPPFMRQRVGDINTGIFAWTTNISCFVGLSISTADCVYGITGITYATPLTDNLAAQLMETVPLTRRTNFKWFMNRRGQTTLQISRSSIKNQPALAANGTPAWSPPPIAMEGHEIIVTDSITNTENNS